MAIFHGYVSLPEGMGYWINLKENLEETMFFPGKHGGVIWIPAIFPVWTILGMGPMIE